MESITKNRQSPEVLRAMVERAYGAEQVPTGEGWASELGHGWFNVAYRIRLRDGADVVLKIAPPPQVEVMTYERGAMSIELKTLELIRTQTSVAVPDVHYADQSHELCDADYFFMPYIDADNLGIISSELRAAERDAYMEQLGAANREINSIRGPGFGPLAGPHDPSWRRVFTDEGPSMKHTTLGTLYPADAVGADREKGTWYRVSLQHRSASGLKSGTAGRVTKTGLEPQVSMQSD